MNHKFLIVLLALLIPYSIMAEENKTVVTKVYTPEKYYEIQQPIMMDITNLQGQKSGDKDLLGSFISFPQSSAYTEELKANIYDYIQLPKSQKNTRIYLLSFDISSDKFAKSLLKVRGPSMLEVYLNGKKEGEKTTIETTNADIQTVNVEFSLLPANKYNVVIKYMSLPSNTLPEEVKITIEPKEKSTQINYNLTHTPKRKVTIEDILIGKRIANSKISPKGDYVLLEYNITQSDGKTYSEKELLSLKNNRRISLSSLINYGWMPTTNKLFYIKRTSEFSNLITIDPETLEESVFAQNIPDGVCRFTPDEKTLLYTETEEARTSTDDLIRLTAPESVQPNNDDRKFIARYNIASGIKERLTFGKNSTTIEDVSADSRYVLYSVSTYEPTKRPFFFNSLYRLDLETLSLDTIYANEGFAESAIFSPGAKKILIQGSAEAFNGIGNVLPANEIPNSYNKLAFIMDLQTKQVEAITRDFSPSIDDFYWSKDDGMIYFLVTEKDYNRVYSYNPNNKEYEMLKLSEDVVRDFDLSNLAAKATYYGVGLANSTRAYSYDLKNKRSTLIADPYQSTLNNLNLSKVEDWNFTSTDGATIYGRYYLPPNFDPSKKYPLIVYYYGGTVPTARTFEAPYPSQVYAALGYVVYVLQPSGSIGFGQQFAAEHVNGWGKQNAQDIIDGTKQFIKEHSFVNEKKVGCIGASYGGYLTMYLQTQTDLFAAAVSHAGISSIASYWGEGYWGYTYSSGASANSYPWNNPELYVKQSPLFNADKINTPMLLLHGTVDTNVPIGESMQLYTALKVLGKPVEFIQIKGENHGIRDFKKRIEWNNSIYAWFAKWLQDDSSWWNNMYPSEK